ncbi:LuxR C-terminal-related transcriptional regulator [Pseudarthrobacter sp. J1738]|uniref:helix-turn-helix transcriptional regulator n=1 Tax=Pseudarthrobacter sp. J1738 TaxID=3420446 RepID=UPI003D2950DB
MHRSVQTRRREFENIKALIQRPRENALLVHGPTGSGRTRLLGQVSEASEAPATMMSAGPTHGAEPLSGLFTLTAGGALPSSNGLGRVSPGGEAPTSDELLALGQHIVDSMVAQNSGPRVVLIDDLDLADPQTLQVMGYVMRRLAGTGVWIVASVQEICGTGPLHGIRTLDLQPLSRTLMMELAISEAPSNVDTGVLRMLVDSVDGNPGALLKALRSLDVTQLDGRHPLSLPLRQDAATAAKLLRQLEPHSAASKEVLTWMSTAPGIRVATLKLALPKSYSAVTELLAAGLAGHLGEGIRITQPALRSALYWSLDPELRTHIHATLAEHSIQPLKQWHQSFSDFSTETARSLRKTSAELISMGFVREGIEFTERASILGPAADEDCEDLVVLGETLLAQGEIELARTFAGRAQLLRSSGDLPLRITGLQIACEYFLTQRVLSNVARSTTEQESDGGRELATGLVLAVASLHTDRWELDAARRALKSARAMPGISSKIVAVLADSIEALINALDLGVAPVVPTTAVQELGRVCQNVHDPSMWVPFAVVNFARACYMAENFDEGRSLLDSLFHQQGKLSPLWSAIARLERIELERRAGNHGVALMEMASVIKSDEPDVFRHTMAVNTSWYWFEIGEQELAAEAYLASVRYSQGRRNIEVNGLVDARRGSFNLRAGDVDEALVYLRRCQQTGMHLRNPQLMRFEPDLVEALVRVGDVREAKEVMAEFEERAARTPSRWAQLAVLRCRAVLQDGEASIAAFEEALSAFTESDSEYDHAITLAIFAQRLSELGKDSRARQLIHAAQMSFTDIGLPLWADILDHQEPLPDGDLQAHLLLKMPETQRQVVELVMAGYRNKEIADELFLSVRTVEVRLTKVYKELGVKSRAQLLARLGAG